jgi:hypothetical protein
MCQSLYFAIQSLWGRKTRTNVEVDATFVCVDLLAVEPRNDGIEVHRYTCDDPKYFEELHFRRVSQGDTGVAPEDR